MGVTIIPEPEAHPLIQLRRRLSAPGSAETRFVCVLTADEVERTHPNGPAGSDGLGQGLETIYPAGADNHMRALRREKPRRRLADAARQQIPSAVPGKRASLRCDGTTQS